jgi:hypothetical protein
MAVYRKGEYRNKKEYFLQIIIDTLRPTVVAVGVTSHGLYVAQWHNAPLRFR